ncbi:MAG: NAD-dependent epimerase/dehydratase family protein [Beijerinckiaceae bacterium]
MLRNIRTLKFNSQTYIRMAADAFLMLAGLILAMLVSSQYTVASLQDTDTTLWLPFLILFAMLAVAAFSVFGLYSSYRYKPIRQKLEHTVYAATANYAFFAFLLSFSKQISMAKALIFLGAWALSVALVVGVRVARHMIRQDDAVNHGLSGGLTPAERAKNVLVIGGAGYIGSALVPKLLADGYNVTILDMLAYGIEPIASFKDHPNFKFVDGDFRNVASLVTLTRSAGTVVHLGGLVGDPACAVDEDLTVDINLTSTKLIGQVAKAHGVSRFIFASSCSVYGASDEIVDETSAFNPQSLYAKTKGASEAVLTELYDRNFCVTSMRFATIYGISGRTRFDLVVNLLAAKAIRDKKITVFGSDQWRPFVHVEDVADALRLALKAPVSAVANRAFNVGSDEQNYTLGELAEKIHAMVPDSEIVVDDTFVDKRNYRVSFARISSVLGFKPRWTLEKGIQQVIDTVRSGAISDYNDVPYSNLRFMKEHGHSFFERTVVSGWEEVYMAQTTVPGLAADGAKPPTPAKTGGAKVH